LVCPDPSTTFFPDPIFAHSLPRCSRLVAPRPPTETFAPVIPLRALFSKPRQVPPFLLLFSGAGDSLVYGKPLPVVSFRGTSLFDNLFGPLFSRLRSPSRPSSCRLAPYEFSPKRRPPRVTVYLQPPSLLTASCPGTLSFRKRFGRRPPFRVFPIDRAPEPRGRGLVCVLLFPVFLCSSFGIRGNLAQQPRAGSFLHGSRSARIFMCC